MTTTNNRFDKWITDALGTDVKRAGVLIESTQTLNFSDEFTVVPGLISIGATDITLYEDYTVNETAVASSNTLGVGIGLQLTDYGAGDVVIDHHLVEGLGINIAPQTSEGDPTGGLIIGIDPAYIADFAPSNVAYIVTTSSAGLSNERLLTGSGGITITDNGSSLITIGAPGVPSVVRGAQSQTTSPSYTDSNLSLPVTAGHFYRFEFDVGFTTAVSTTGAAFGVNNTAAQGIGYRTLIEGPGGVFEVDVSNDSWNALNVTTGLDGSKKGYARVEGRFKALTNGTIVLRYATEVNGSAVTIDEGSSGMLWDLGT